MKDKHPFRHPSQDQVPKREKNQFALKFVHSDIQLQDRVEQDGKMFKKMGTKIFITIQTFLPNKKGCLTYKIRKNKYGNSKTIKKIFFAELNTNKFANMAEMSIFLGKYKFKYNLKYNLGN